MTGANVRTVIPDKSHEETMEIAVRIHQRAGKAYTALLARIEEAEGNNYGMYISHDETEESSGLRDDDPNQRVVIANR
jgi:hypothetical protein